MRSQRVPTAGNGGVQVAPDTGPTVPDFDATDTTAKVDHREAAGRRRDGWPQGRDKHRKLRTPAGQVDPAEEYAGAAAAVWSGRYGRQADYRGRSRRPEDTEYGGVFRSDRYDVGFDCSADGDAKTWPWGGLLGGTAVRGWWSRWVVLPGHG
uniref:(northern house mosquito) hypothetical protein n=1 Tax=Culex pipiens TaxID=7175 RepID=A0A8D8N3K6_CULPI